MTELAGYFDGAYVRFLEGANIKPNLPKKFIHVMFGNHKNPHKIKQK